MYTYVVHKLCGAYIFVYAYTYVVHVYVCMYVNIWYTHICVCFYKRGKYTCGKYIFVGHTKRHTTLCIALRVLVQKEP